MCLSKRVKLIKKFGIRNFLIRDVTCKLYGYLCSMDRVKICNNFYIGTKVFIGKFVRIEIYNCDLISWMLNFIFVFLFNYLIFYFIKLK